MQDEVRVLHFLECRPERRHELRREVRYEADRVREDDAAAGGQHGGADGRVEGREQLVLHDDVLGLGHRTNQRRLAGVGVAHDGDAGHHPTGPLHRSRPPHVLQLRLQFCFEFNEAAALNFELCLARPRDEPRTGCAAAAGTDDVKLPGAALIKAKAAGAEGKTHKSAAQVRKAREVDLDLGLAAVRALCEDLEYEGVAVPHGHLHGRYPVRHLGPFVPHRVLQVPLLRGAESSIDEHHDVDGPCGKVVAALAGPRWCVVPQRLHNLLARLLSEEGYCLLDLLGLPLANVQIGRDLVKVHHVRR
mmetsp:Transcript_7254/g.12404  ORF Transcript_7254/g.12404 Transcript_7254/m.12404 type:complete len:304 (+) Transcript_7254:712-1623(+)